MQSTEIAASQGSGWNPARWEQWRPALLSAAEQASIGCNDIDLPNCMPREMLVDRVDSYTSARGLVGECYTSQFFKINVLRRHTGTVLNRLHHDEWSATIFHELMHATRMELIKPDSNFAETAATEGVAYVAEDDYIQGYCDANVPGLIDASMLLKTFSTQGEFMHLLKSRRRKEQAMRWFDEPAYELPHISRGVLHAVQLVHHQVYRNGLSVRELIGLPAKEVLGV